MLSSFLNSFCQWLADSCYEQGPGDLAVNKTENAPSPVELHL